MSRIQIVLDTNVLVSAFRSRLGASFALLSTLGDTRWQLNVSTALALEYEAALKREFLRQGRPIALVDDMVDILVAAANRCVVFFRWRPFLRDPKDDFVLELAVASGAYYIVTHNVRDFAGSDVLGVLAIRPGDFLRLLKEGGP